LFKTLNYIFTRIFFDIMEKAGVYLILGGDKGLRWENLKLAKEMINEMAGTIITESSVYETQAWGFNSDSKFLNQVVQIHTALEPLELLNVLHIIEDKLGRERNENQYASRTMDIDLLFYHQLIIETADITIPHPRIAVRKFVLDPLAEIAPGFVHPVLHQTILELNIRCEDSLTCNVVEENILQSK
jgi:2-amino-4-hydroxy-6-hydroxymethyldihydropteridine diphosphokinase